MRRAAAALAGLAAALAAGGCATAPRPGPATPPPPAAAEPGPGPRPIPAPAPAAAPPAPAAAPPAPASGPAAPVDGEPAFVGPGWTRPRLREPGCEVRGLSAPRGLWGLEQKVVVKLAVHADGRVDRVELVTSVADGAAPPGSARRFERSLVAAVQACAFEPGRDPAGRPASTWLLLPIRVTGAGAAP